MAQRFKRARGTTSFVPRIVLQTFYVGVVPAVALATFGACGVALAVDAIGADAARDATDVRTTGVADTGFDAGNDALDATPTPDAMGVADVGFDAGLRDVGVIVLAVIGFDFEPPAQREPLAGPRAATMPAGQRSVRARRSWQA
jgi:hypothetical protein